MKRWRDWLWFGVLAGALGCAHSRAEPVDFRPLPAGREATMMPLYREKVADSFEIVESVRIVYRNRPIQLLGYTQVDEKADRLTVAGLTPAGVKMFEFEAIGNQIEFDIHRAPEEEAMDTEAFVQGMAEDIRKIYFKRVPGDQAERTVLSDRLRYSEASQDGRLEFVFGGPDEALVEKTFYRNGSEVWKVQYTGYESRNGRIYPGRIYFEDKKRDLNIHLELKEIRA